MRVRDRPGVVVLVGRGIDESVDTVNPFVAVAATPGRISRRPVKTPPPWSIPAHPWTMRSPILAGRIDVDDPLASGICGGEVSITSN
jgi:hypothetical protein